MLLYIAFAAVGFLCGGILFSYHIPKILRGINIVEKSADSNPGTANAIKYGGIFIGILCLILDLAKGFLPVFISGMFISRAHPLFALIIAAPVIGHSTAIFYKFSGGKGIAPAFGCFLGLIPFSYCAVTLAVLYITAAGIFRIKPHEKCSVIVFTVFAALQAAVFIHTGYLSVFMGCAAISAVCGCKNFADYKRRYKTAECQQELLYSVDCDDSVDDDEVMAAEQRH